MAMKSYILISAVMVETGVIVILSCFCGALVIIIIIVRMEEQLRQSVKKQWCGWTVAEKLWVGSKRDPSDFLVLWNYKDFYFCFWHDRPVNEEDGSNHRDLEYTDLGKWNDDKSALSGGL